jgi:hypothetical protein
VALRFFLLSAIFFIRPSQFAATQARLIHKTMPLPSDVGAEAAPPVLDWAQIEKDTFGLVEQLTPAPRPSEVPPPRQRHKPDTEQYLSELGRSLAVLSEQVGRLEKSGNQDTNNVAAGGPCPAAHEAPAAAATSPPADHDDRRRVPFLSQYGDQPRPYAKQPDYPAAQDGTRALLCLMQHSRHRRILLHQQCSLDQFRALIDSNLLFDSIGCSKEEALAMRVAELEGRVQELEQRAEKTLLPPPAEEESSRVLHLERVLHKVSK